jgi:hypothetical protein
MATTDFAGLCALSAEKRLKRFENVDSIDATAEMLPLQISSIVLGMRGVPETQIENFLAFADALGDAARAAILPHFRNAPAVEGKQGKRTGFDPVTAADREAERSIRRMIESRFPDHGIVGEEFGEKPSRSGYTWILDPIDGTRSFIAGLPLWGGWRRACFARGQAHAAHARLRAIGRRKHRHDRCETLLGRRSGRFRTSARDGETRALWLRLLRLRDGRARDD